MKRISKLTLSCCLLLSLATPAFTMDWDDTTEPIKIAFSPVPHSILPEELQKSLTVIGHEVLSNIIEDNNFDVASSGLFERISQCGIFDREVSYSKLASFAPSNTLRWAFSSSDQGYVIKRKNHMSAIIALSWAMVDLARKQNDFFQRGSFTVVDPNHRLSNFLLGYVKLTTGYADPQSVPLLLTPYNFAYRRDPKALGSSHHRDHCPESQFGIDVRFEPYGGVLKLLPFDATHLLFAKLNIEDQEEPLLFLKLEDIGLGSVGAMGIHGVDFMNTHKNIPLAARREKDILPEIRGSFKDLQTKASLDGDFKTIRSMYRKAQNILQLVNYQAEAQAFMDKVNSQYPNGNNHLRCGNEVIIDLRH